MSFRFRRTLKISPGVRLNFSKSGISTTVGRRGAGVTMGKRGTYANTGIPGTGMSYRTRVDGGKSSSRRTAAYSTTSNQTSVNYFKDSLKSVKSIFDALSGWLWKIGIISFFILLFVNTDLIALSGLFITGGVVAWIYASSTEPGKARRFIQRAEKYVKADEHEKGLECIIMANELNPTSVIKDDIIELSSFLEKYDLLIRYLEVREGKDMDDYLLLGHSHLAIGDFDKTVEYFELIADQVEESANTTMKESFYFKYGAALAKSGREKKGIEYLQKVNEGSEDYYVQAIKFIGACFCSLKMYDLAIEKLGPYIRSRKLNNIDHLEIAYFLGVACLRVGDKKRAKTWLNKVYAQDASFKDIDKLLGELAA